MNGVHFASIISVNMFLLAIIFSLKYPSDDGRCSMLTDKDECLSEKRYNGESLCTWADTSAWTGCYHYNSTFDLQSLTLIAGLHLLLVAPIEAIINAIFDKILYSPLISQIEQQKSTAKLANTSDVIPIPTIINPPSSKKRFKRSGRSMLLSSEPVTGMSVMKEFLELRKKAFEIMHVSISRRDDFNSNDIKDYDSFISSFASYREALSQHRKSLLDSRWSSILKDNYQVDTNNVVTFNNDDLLKGVIDKTQELCDEFHRHMKHSLAYEAGGQLMKQFLLDILGRDTDDAKVFKQLIDKELKSELAVTRCFKYSFALIVISLNLYFLYATMLYSKGTSSEWQFNWVRLFIINIGFDLFVGQPFKVYIIQYIIPICVSDHMLLVKSTLDNLVTMIMKNTKYRSTKLSLFSASDYFFVSTRLANKRPDLLESFFVLSYRSPYPTTQLISDSLNSSKSTEIDRPDVLQSKHIISVVHNAIKRGIFQFAIAPVVIQDIVLDIVKPLLPVGLVIMYYNIGLINMLYFCAGVIAFVLIYLLYRRQQSKKTVLPVHDTEVHDDDTMYNDYYDNLKMPPPPMMPGNYPSHLLDDEKTEEEIVPASAPPPNTPGSHPLLAQKLLLSDTNENSNLNQTIENKVGIKTSAQLKAHLASFEFDLFDVSSDSSSEDSFF